MRRKELVYAALAFCYAVALAGCNNKPADGHSSQQSASSDVDSTASVVNEDSLRVVAEQQAAIEEATKAIEEQVALVYDQVEEAYCTSPVGESIDLDGLYCSDDWLQTIDAVRVKDTTRQDQPFTDVDYWVMGKEVAGPIEATDITVDSLDLTEGKAQVSMHLHNGPGDEPLLLKMVMVDDSWRIDEFIQLQPDTFVWKASMKDYLNGVEKEKANPKMGVKKKAKKKRRGRHST